MLEKIKLTPRIWFALGAVACFSMLGIGAYFQFVEYLEPCPLCISQRIMILFTGLVFLIAAIHNPAACGRKIYAIIGTITALMGAGISARHVWLQHLPPDEVPECGPGLSYVFANFPLTETLKLMLNGTGECADVLWTFLGLSIPGWTLVAFLLLAMLSLLQFWNQPAEEGIGNE
ncbi:disulfide bond formation protein B [methane-oxidizing endosymbiont of Gigantopelta aegis]|uniref:disulfide bond formation protein B n=1 Tax=methane-oxidizing endosymbiont of Gigantopelta aegis TaxID=2794938 RepID=UPI0018DDE2F6|nr:disulfide bond formation protein B [methane-oxidizing endosymbiont of Gigantopelta aegis]